MTGDRPGRVSDRPSRWGTSSLGLAFLLLGPCVAWGLAAAGEPGLPFTEDFADTDLRDAAATNADWSTEAQALLLARSHRHFGAFEPAVAGIDISADAHFTFAVAHGDVDGDGDLDLVAGNDGERNRLHPARRECRTREGGTPETNPL